MEKSLKREFAHLYEQLHSVRDYIRWGASRFGEAALHFGHGTDNAWDEAVMLVMHALHLPLDSDARVLDARLTEDEKKAVITLLLQRVNDPQPAPYLTGTAWFAGLEFSVDPRVLIPRSPIGELIEQGFHPWLSGAPQRILDMCTGSGCIGIACAWYFPEAQVELSDISADALDVARANVAKHGLQERVAVLESDLFANLSGSYDLIVVNPPYVNAADMAALPVEFHREPVLALASGDDGLDFTRRLLQDATRYMSEEGVLIVEVGNSWPALQQAYSQVPFTWLEFERGGHGVFAITREQLIGSGL